MRAVGVGTRTGLEAADTVKGEDEGGRADRIRSGWIGKVAVVVVVVVVERRGSNDGPRSRGVVVRKEWSVRSRHDGDPRSKRGRPPGWREGATVMAATQRRPSEGRKRWVKEARMDEWVEGRKHFGLRLFVHTATEQRYTAKSL